MAAIVLPSWPRRLQCPDASAPALPRPDPARPVSIPARTSHSPPTTAIPGRSPDSGGRRPAPGPREHPDGVDAARLPSAAPPPEYGHGRAPGPGPATPDSAAQPVSDSPGTTA